MKSTKLMPVENAVEKSTEKPLSVEKQAKKMWSAIHKKNSPASMKSAVAGCSCDAITQ